MGIPETTRTLVTRLFDRLDLTDPGTGDLLFNIFGAGNQVTEPDRPFERFRQYEDLLKLLRSHNAQRYAQIHKGTAFWFLSWLSFDLRNYPKALFYMDAAISEDVRRVPSGWLNEPAGAFLTLTNPSVLGAGKHVASIRGILDAEVGRFNQCSGEPALTVAQVVDGFVTGLLQEPRHRTLVSAWYLQLLEFQERQTELSLRSAEGGSIEPFLDLLFRGGLLLESVLKVLYPTAEAGQDLQTLGAIYNESASFQRDFGSGFKTRARDVSSIVKAIGPGAVANAFTVSAQLRNTTGHNLIWDAGFTEPAIFQRLFEFEIDAMLFVVARKFR